VITVRVRLFAAYREAVGRSELLIEAPDKARVSWLIREVVRQHPQVEGRLTRAAYAVNRDHADPDRVLADGDEVVFIPPVSGGSGSGRSRNSAFSNYD
jgi:molybdopterin converting factor subunit 1